MSGIIEFILFTAREFKHDPLGIIGYGVFLLTVLGVGAGLYVWVMRNKNPNFAKPKENEGLSLGDIMHQNMVQTKTLMEQNIDLMKKNESVMDQVNDLKKLADSLTEKIELVQKENDDIRNECQNIISELEKTNSLNSKLNECVLFMYKEYLNETQRFEIHEKYPELEYIKNANLTS